MKTLDYICLAVIFAVIFIGVTFGFGKILKFITKGWSGRIISIVVCYFTFSLVYSFPFVQDLLARLMALIPRNANFFFGILNTIRIDIIILAVLLFFTIQVLRIIIVKLIDTIVEIDRPIMRIINRCLGIVLAFAVLLIAVYLVFSMDAIIYGSESGLIKSLEGSVFRLDSLYLNNPIKNAINALFKKVTDGNEAFFVIWLF